MMIRVKVGCCGFPKGMKGYFPLFDVVEVQQTFYKPPRLETALRWRGEAPGDFEFVVKAWQLITHPPKSPTYRRAGVEIEPERERSYGFFRPTDEVMGAWQRTAEVAEALGARIILFQCPASFEPSPENVENIRVFFRSVERDFTFAWEVRGGWDEGLVKSLCEELDLVHCVDPTQGSPLCRGLRYFRLHGGPGYRHNYSDEELERLKGMIGGGETYFMFNNLAMYDDALRFKRLLEGAGV